MKKILLMAVFVALAAPAFAQTISGRIEAVDAEAGLVRIQPDAGEAVSLHLDQTSVVRGAGAAGVSALRPGDRVEANVERRGDMAHASSVTLLDVAPGTEGDASASTVADTTSSTAVDTAARAGVEGTTASTIDDASPAIGGIDTAAPLSD